MTFDCRLLAQAVWFSYGGNPAVRDVSLSVAPGDTVALVGPNGSGKTTLLRLLSGALKAERGVVNIDGRPIASSSPRELARKIAVVPQHVDPTLALTVESMVALGRTPYYGTAPTAIAGRSSRARSRPWKPPKQCRCAASDITNSAEASNGA